jgi:hypothetical protein
MKLIFIPSVDTVYSGISLEMFLAFTRKSSNKNMSSLGRVRIYNPLNRLLHEFLGLTPAINVTNFCKVNIFLLFDELPQKVIPDFIVK